MILTEICRKAILDCFGEMKDYLHSKNVMTEQRFSEMEFAISKLKIAIPKYIFGKIEDFIRDELEPIVYMPELVFAPHLLDDIWYDDYDIWYDDETVTSTPSSTPNTRLLENERKETLRLIENRLDKFGEDELRYYLSHF